VHRLCAQGWQAQTTGGGGGDSKTPGIAMACIVKLMMTFVDTTGQRLDMIRNGQDLCIAVELGKCLLQDRLLARKIKWDICVCTYREKHPIPRSQCLIPGGKRVRPGFVHLRPGPIPLPGLSKMSGLGVLAQEPGRR
jgi:hypothetical protein